MENKYWKVIGLMSGTSLDGLDIIYTHISTIDSDYSFNIIYAETIPYSKKWELLLRNAFESSKKTIDNLNIEYGEYLGNSVLQFVKKNNIETIDFIASHGHTIFHKPNEGITVQIGDGQSIANKTGMKVICDFRSQDVKFGGQGAPLVPIGDKLLFSEYNYCLNLGGFANISFEKNKERIAFDICPVNIVMNHYVKSLNLDFDKDGEIASKGKIDEILLNELNNLPFFNAPIPKSLGFEFVKDFIFPMIDSRNLTIETILRTFVAHIVIQITACLDNNKNSKILITGGGAFNKFLINELKNHTKNLVFIPENKIVDYKEALIFALLGVLRSENQVNCLSSVTGAKKDHSSGVIFYKSL
tara:strand:- start:777 stop:1850 length:1074 start_codon:yes stop_codon:yes gene_type:complete